MKRTLSLLACLAMLSATQAQTFDMTQPQPIYSDATGYGYDIAGAPDKKGTHPWYFSVRVPDGNYRVTVEVGSKKRAASTVVRAESRRLYYEEINTRKGKTERVSFVVSKRSPRINDNMQVKLKQREHGYLNWDDRLTLEFNGKAPAVSSITITPDTTATTIFLCGNSTVVDQELEPWASWGQMIPRWFGDQVAISNHAESGLTATTFLGQNRLEKILTMMRTGDYVICEFGHNDEKEKRAGDGAWYNYVHSLKIFVDKVRAKGGTIVFVTPTQRRFFESDGKTLRDTHGDYPAAMKSVAAREQVPLIDLHQMTREFFETLGLENSKRSLVHYPANSYPNQAKELADNTHFNPYGAYEVSKMIVMGLRRLGLPIVNQLRPDWHDFQPTAPDDFNTFVWYPSILNGITKPDGN